LKEEIANDPNPVQHPKPVSFCKRLMPVAAGLYVKQMRDAHQLG
jgi:hypothetical protein